MDYHEKHERSMLVSGITALLATAFTILGFSLLVLGTQVAAFDTWRGPLVLRDAVAVLAIAGSLAASLPSVRFWGVLVLALVALNQLAVHVARGEAVLALASATALALALLVGWWRRPWIAYPPPEVWPEDSPNAGSEAA